MRHPFEDAPHRLRSINVARVVALPDELATDDVVDRLGYQLVSGMWLQRELALHATALGLDIESRRLFRDFAAELLDPEAPAAVRTLATEIALRLGRHLGCLLLVLALGDPANRAVRPDWADDQWAFWAGVRRVVLGGGLLSGAIGDVAVPEAQAVLDAHGAAHLRIERSVWRDAIGLVGMARLGPVQSDRRAVFDFGQTAVKRAIARYRAGCLTGMQVLPPGPCPCPYPVRLSTDRVEVAAQWAQMVGLMVETVRAAGPAPADPVEVAVSLACYLDDGVPDPAEATACYGRLAVLRSNLSELFHDDLAQALTSNVQLQLEVDGTAAALAEDPDERCVVLTVGTAMGVGFPLARHPRVPIDYSPDGLPNQS